MDPSCPRPRAVASAEGAAGFFLDPQLNDSFRAVNRLLAAGQEVRRLEQPFTAGGTNSRGRIVLHSLHGPPRRRSWSASPLSWALRSPAVQSRPATKQSPFKPVRIGLWDRYGGSMPSGWTRWLLERFEFPFQVVFPPELDKGGLREKFDVLIFVDGAIPGGGSCARAGRSARPARRGGDQPPAEEPHARNSRAEHPRRIPWPAAAASPSHEDRAPAPRVSRSAAARF